MGLPEEDVTSLHSLEERFDSAKPILFPPPHPKPCPQIKKDFAYQEVVESKVQVPHSATELVELHGKINNNAKESEMENVLRISLVGGMK